MGANKAADYSIAVRGGDDEQSVDVEDADFSSYFDNEPVCDFKPESIQKNRLEVTIPEIPDEEVLTKLKHHPMWNEYNKHCVSCSTCITTTDVIYNENSNVGERKRSTTSRQIEGFANMQADIAGQWKPVSYSNRYLGVSGSLNHQSGIQDSLPA